MKYDVKNFLTELKRRSLEPKNIQFSKWQEWTIVSSFNVDDGHFISENASTGIDKNPEIALLKSLTEFCERNIFRSSDDFAAKATERSDGFAAYPNFLPDSKNLVRANAFNEAIERYLWASWWDNLDSEYFIENSNFIDKDKLISEFGLVDISSIFVKSSNSNIELNILIAETKSGGFVTGGAAGEKLYKDKTFSRAFGELLRHLFVLRRMSEQKLENLTFYEQRLWGFGSGIWQDKVIERLKLNGNKILTLPFLVIDQEINHNDRDLITVHRCLFKDQPVFMGGEIERLCI